jgi:hypothetical protein
LTPGAFWGSPFLYSDYDSSEPYVIDNSLESTPPQVVFVQPALAGDAPRKTPSAPLLIEWQGNRYVRFGGANETEESGASEHPDYAEPNGTTSRMSATQKDRGASPGGELPPVVLVYRDGHREEIPGYAIADGIIYVRGNDWQSGWWTKHIPLSALDPAATMQSNQERGVKFMLPSAPNVVIASF